MRDVLKEEVGRRLTTIRNRLGLSPQRMAALMNVSKTSLNRLERGLSYPSAVTFHRLFKQFSVSIDWLLCNRGSMFTGEAAKQKEKSADLFGGDLEEMVYLMKRIPLVRYSMMDHFQRFKIDNQVFIDRELEKIKETEDK